MYVKFINKLSFLLYVLPGNCATTFQILLGIPHWASIRATPVMLGLSDFLTLQGQNPAAHILKPWWDILADYLIRILLLISVVTGAVSLYVKDIVCVPAITCPVAVTSPSRNSLVQDTCATFYNSNRRPEIISASEITVLTTFPDPSLNVFVNSECKRLGVTWFSMFLPFVLFYQAGACLVLHNIWFNLSASVAEQFSNLVNECYDSSDKILTDTGREAKTKEVEELKRLMVEFEKDACRNLMYVLGKVVEAINEPSKTLELQRKMNRFADGLDGSGKLNSFSYFRIRKIYKVELFFQCFFLVFFLVVNFTCGWFEGSFKCNIEEFVPGFVQDHFICSYVHSEFYIWSLIGFQVCLVLHLFVNVRRAVWFFKEGSAGFNSNGKQDPIPPGDFAFFLNLLKTSNPIYLDSVSSVLPQPTGKGRSDKAISDKATEGTKTSVFI